ncbi:MAG TPA: hypothetical protein VIC62_21355, partial [Nakamurella sp.]
MLASEFEGERPGRTLAGWPSRLVDAAAVAVALLVIWQVFAPLPAGSQYYLIWFLTGTLPLVFLTYPATLRTTWWRWGRKGTGPPPTGPSVPDWVLAAVAAIVCVYPILPMRGGYDGFLDRQ